MRGGEDLLPLAVTESVEYSPAISPNGSWLAYVSNRSGVNEVYVVPFPEAGGSLRKVSVNGGVDPMWAHGGEELFYRNNANELVSVEVSTDTTFTVFEEHVLFSMAPYLSSNGHPMYDVSPDDQSFVMLRIEQALSGSELIVVVNWAEELREREPN